MNKKKERIKARRKWIKTKDWNKFAGTSPLCVIVDDVTQGFEEHPLEHYPLHKKRLQTPEDNMKGNITR